MLLGVLDDECLLRHGVLEVVHDECCQPVECLELPALGELLGRQFLRQVAGDLLSRRFQQIVILEIQLERRGRRRQFDEAQQLSIVEQRNDECRIREFVSNVSRIE